MGMEVGVEGEGIRMIRGMMGVVEEGVGGGLGG
jgi:hypothetical protein